MAPRTRSTAAGSVPERRDVYERLADELRQEIVSGRYKPGDRLPSTLELMERTGVANLTVRGAYRTLIEEGLVEAISKRGFYVRRPNAMTWRMNPGSTARRAGPSVLDFWAADVEAAGLAHREEISLAIDDSSVLVLGRPIGERLGLPERSRVLVRRAIRYTGPAGAARRARRIPWPMSTTPTTWSVTPRWRPRHLRTRWKSSPGSATSRGAASTKCGHAWPPPTSAVCSACRRFPSCSSWPAPPTRPIARRWPCCTRYAAATAPPSATRSATQAGDDRPLLSGGTAPATP